MTAPQVPVSNAAKADATTTEGGVHEVAPDVAYQRLAIVNVAFVGPRGGPWVLIDAGITGSAALIAAAAEARFGKGSRPEAIVLTHGHFDHVGALLTLADRWDVPVYAHALETPYLDGISTYPPPDPTVGGGLMASLSGFFPRSATNVGHRLKPLPDGDAVPGLPGWRWLHTPGHTPGHVSLWRPSDRTLIVGDAFITTRQESAFAVLLQTPELHGPPMYYTTDWPAAKASVQRLAALEPELVVTGHGPALSGQEMRDALHTLARDFDRVAVPAQGRYVSEPAKADHAGTRYIPPEPKG